jgi:hypothetical protein
VAAARDGAPGAAASAAGLEVWDVLELVALSAGLPAGPRPATADEEAS